MNSAEQRIKDILDRECYKIWQKKSCQQRNRYCTNTPCWPCPRNEALTNEIYEASKKEEVKV